MTINIDFDFDISKISFDTILRVRYAETDNMGVVYYGNYFTWFEVARTDVLRQLGYPYSLLEKDGVLLPVVEASARYMAPFRYDEEVLIKSKITEFNEIKIVFNYDAYRLSDMKLCTCGRTRHAFIGPDGRVLKNDPGGKVKALADLLKRYQSKASEN
ncbi:MAG TPA: thioesterase family protein [Candidatus Wallbacteria bacterium]|nr:MAG: Acyl-CoA thioester hydrolase YbgC [bacterium ADurb.Bin243]HOD41675.1 thioesterase family protein [Candidatus Wallbacteria bacterium]HPG58197.1 thioesterase family protein [Candidatus Wallbacteria bacterium]